MAMKRIAELKEEELEKVNGGNETNIAKTITVEKGYYKFIDNLYLHVPFTIKGLESMEFTFYI